MCGAALDCRGLKGQMLHKMDQLKQPRRFYFDHMAKPLPPLLKDVRVYNTEGVVLEWHCASWGGFQVIHCDDWCLGREEEPYTINEISGSELAGKAHTCTRWAARSGWHTGTDGLTRDSDGNAEQQLRMSGWTIKASERLNLKSVHTSPEYIHMQSPKYTHIQRDCGLYISLGRSTKCLMLYPLQSGRQVKGPLCWSSTISLCIHHCMTCSFTFVCLSVLLVFQRWAVFSTPHPMPDDAVTGRAAAPMTKALIFLFPNNL